MPESLLKKQVSLDECPPPLLTINGKRRGRKPGANSTLAQRSAANSRERSRMRVLSTAFVDLKGALPWVPKDTKLSKLDTLKLAAGYIAYLKSVLVEDSSGVSLPPPWTAYDIYAPQLNNSAKCSLTRTWDLHQTSSFNQTLKMNYAGQENLLSQHQLSSNNLLQELIDFNPSPLSDRNSQTQCYYKIQNRNNYFL